MNCNQLQLITTNGESLQLLVGPRAALRELFAVASVGIEIKETWKPKEHENDNDERRTPNDDVRFDPTLLYCRAFVLEMIHI